MMGQSLGGATRMSLEEIRHLSVRALRRAGVPAAHAETVARVLVEASERGHHSHGVELLPMYVDRIAHGGIRPAAIPVWEIPPPATITVLDAQGGCGQVAMAMAVDHAARAAADAGAAIVAVRNNNHVGMLAAYRHSLIATGAVGLLLNISGPSVAAPQARRATLGNDAFCLVAPSDDPATGDLICDFATGIVASGKIRHRGYSGEPVPSGWLLDADGRPSTDPADLDAGGSVPVFGDHKGLCVALTIEVLAGILAGDTISPLVNKQRHQPDAVMGCSQLVIALHPSHFGGRDVGRLLESLHEAVRRGYDETPDVYYPEQQEQAAAVAARDGVAVPAAVRALLSEGVDA